jgi:hypothetical protein
MGKVAWAQVEANQQADTKAQRGIAREARKREEIHNMGRGTFMT